MPTGRSPLAAAARRVGIEPLDRGGHLRHRLAEARAERPVVRLHAVGDQLGLLGDELELPHVQLGTHDVARAARSRRARRRSRRSRPWRAAGASSSSRRRGPRGRARSPAAAAWTPASSSGSPTRPSARGEVREVDRIAVAGQVAVDLVGHERHERREHPPTSTRQWRSVPSAARSPSQKRRRERRTYQLESVSTNAEISWPARGAVEVVKLAPDGRRPSPEARETIQRSRSEASPAVADA